MTAFDHFERQLRAGVRRHHRPRVRRWRGPAALAFAAAMLIAGGALAASGTIRIGHQRHDPGERAPRPHVGPGLRAGPATTLGLRVTDPAGGPPWTIRVFASSRGAHCVQVGQVVRGHFGIYTAGVLQPLRAWPGGESSLCSGQSRRGLPIVRGLQRMRVIGGMTDRHRCPARPHRDCPISSVTVLRYGLLGPGARRVRLVDANGRTVASQTTGPHLGGAYLFAVAQDTAPYAAAEATQRTYADALARALQRAHDRGATDLQALREAQREVGSTLAPGAHADPPRLSVIATFSNGQTLRVAGAGRSHTPLPGLGSRSKGPPARLPRDIPVRAKVDHPGRFATVTLSFPAPRAIRRFDVHYTATLHGRTGTGCNRPTGGYLATTRDIDAEETVRFILRRPRNFAEDGRTGWCPGRFTGEIRYSTPKANTTIGTYTFRIP
jgi:hypothetical protein